MDWKTLLLTLAIATPLYSEAEETAEKHKFSLGAGAGNWGLFDDMSAYALHGTYTFAEIESLWRIRPTLMAIWVEGGLTYFSGGLTREFQINDNWFWGLGFQAGVVSDSEILGHELEFYSRIFAGRQMTENLALTVEFGHISNAGFGDSNPGAEAIVLGLNYTF